MPEISVEIEIYCSCGEGLCGNTSSGRTSGRGQEYFTVEPCEKCLEHARDEWYAQAIRELEKDNAHFQKDS